MRLIQCHTLASLVAVAAIGLAATNPAWAGEAGSTASGATESAMQANAMTGNTMSDNAMSSDASRLQPMNGSESHPPTQDSRMAPTQNTSGTGDNPAANE